MSCCGQYDNKNRIEHERFFKPENNNGCGCAGKSDCSTPSRAKPGSPLWNWEQKYGKLVTTVTIEQDEWGHTVQKVEKKPCPVETKKRNTSGCCSLRYKVVR